jgi:hypothetical protein
MIQLRAIYSDIGKTGGSWLVWILRLVGLLIAVVVLGSISASGAVAAPKTLNGFIGGSGGVNAGGLFTQPRDVAVYTADTPDSSDDKIFIVENPSNSSRVHRLDSHGNFELLWGRDVVRPGVPGNTGEGSEVCKAAISGAAGCKSAPPGSREGEFDEPTGLAVSQSTGHVYVMDRNNLRVQEFTLDGEFVRAWGWNVAPEGADGDTPSDQFEICTHVCQAGAAGNGGGQFANTAHNTVAVSPLAPHYVLVTDSGNQRVLQFEAEGQFVDEWSLGFAAGEPRHIAIDQSGVAYASDTTAGGRIVRFDTDPAPPDVALDPLLPSPEPPLLSTGDTKGLEVDPLTGNLLAVRDPGSGPVVVDEIKDPGTNLPPGGPPNPIVTDTHIFSAQGVVHGIGVSTAGNIYLTTTELFPPPIGLFTGCITPIESFDCHGLITLAVASGPLTVSLDSPADVGSESASLVGSVNPGGGVTRYRFQVSDDGENWVDASEPRYVGGDTPIEVAVTASGLEPATLYRVRLAVSKQTGIDTAESAVSIENVFLTDAAAPKVSTLGPSKRTDTSVQLRGLVDPQGSATSYRFEYGPAGGSFDHHLPIPDAEVGSGNSAQVVVQELTGLQSETAYHYRIVATNSVDMTAGDTVTFTTKAHKDVEPPPGRAYELVSPPDKVSGVGTGVWFNGPAAAGLSGHAAYDGERFAVQGTFGAVIVDGKYALANDWALSERTPTGWVTKPVLSRQGYGAHPIVFIQMHSATPSMSLTSWGGTTVKLFPEMENWAKETAGASVYLRDWDQGRWELFGPTQPTQGGGTGLTLSGAISPDGKVALGSGSIRGLAGVADPTLDQAMAAPSVYIDELPDEGPSDTFPGAGVRRPVNVCDAGTRVPRRLAFGKLGEQDCLDPPERQSITIDATGGSFTLTFNGQTTGAIPFNAPATGAGSVQAALEALSNLDTDDVVITGGPDGAGGTSPYVVRFARALGDVSQLSADAGGLTGGVASATVQTVPVAPLIDINGASLTSSPQRAISTDGSRVFFMAPDPLSGTPICLGEDDATSCPPQLYVRQQNSNSVVMARWISKTEVTQANGASADQDASLMGPVIFAGASTDGDKVLFTTDSPLTADDANGQGQAPPVGGIVTGSPSQSSTDLYMYDLPDTPDADPASGDLTRISAGPTGDGDCDAPTGSLRFASEGGTRLYFTCHNALDGVPVTGSGTSTTPGDGSDGVNLYLYDTARPQPERWQFIARLPSDSDINSCAARGASTGMPLGPGSDADPKIQMNGLNPVNCVHGTLDGLFIVFWTAGQLTEDDPDDISGDIYAYDAVEGELVRASAPQGGVGGSYPCAPGTSAVLCYGDGGIGPSGGRTPLPALGVAQDHGSGEKLVFFQSKSRLIPADQDSNYDVYQWKGGELSLITPNTPRDAFFKGNDRTGTNVYFASRNSLSWQDKDVVLDVYSARVGNGIPEPPDTGESCDPVSDQCQSLGQPIQPGQVDSDNQSAGNPPTASRFTLTLSAPSAKARRKAARTGRLPVRVTTTAPALVKLTAKARIVRKNRRIASTRRQADGTITLTLKLSKKARKRLNTGQPLRITLTATAPGSRPAAAKVRLKR